MDFSRSEALFVEAQKVIPGGVNSPVRAFKSVGRNPIFIDKAKGSRVYDVDGNEFIDYVGSWGPMILGHANEEIQEAAFAAIKKGTSYGAPTELEVRMAQMIIDAVPSIEKVRMVSSGTEADMSAIRLARGFTGREKILKFVGCYHGHSDSLLVKAGSGVTTLGLPDSPGVTEGAARDTITLPFNDIESVRQLFKEAGETIACVVVEPIAGNMGVIPPKPGYLEGLRELTSEYGALLIFDEVITGFRVGYGGAQELFGVMPDLTVLGKIIGGGFPVGAFGGSAKIMDGIAPVGSVYQAGTLSGNPVAMAAGIKMLEILKNKEIYSKIDKLSEKLVSGVGSIAKDKGIPIFSTRIGAMSCTFFTDQVVYDYDSAKTSNAERYGNYFRKLIDRGIYFAPSQFEACFVSASHTDADIDTTLTMISDVMGTL